ncbi:MAG: TRAP transporter substrate-binding protein DctP [Synergistaceae bacterium]|nr:TRAP transporter substrate-binding protein DctP [Synergistaceae bacterium]
MKMRSKGSNLFVVLIIAAMFVALSSSFAEAARQLRLGAHYPAGYFVNNGFRRVADRVKEATNGEIEIVLYESGALGSYEQVMQEVIRGTIDAVTMYPTARFSKKFEIVATPALINSYEDLYKLMKKESPFYKYLKSIYEECGTVYIGSFIDSIPGALIRKGKTIENPYDKSNKACQMRVMAQTTLRKWWAAMGYQVASVPYAEVFTSLQTGVIDGDSGSGPEGAYLAFGDVAGTFIEYPVSFFLLDFAMSKKTWDSFDDKTKEIIVNAFEAETESVYQEARESHQKYRKIMQDAGIKILDPTPEQIKLLTELAYEVSWPETEKFTGPEILQDIRAYMGR